MSAHSSFPHNDAEDWSHVRETINMLCLAVCQIEATMSDSNRSVDTLTSSFTALALHSRSVSAKINSLSKPEQLHEFKDDLNNTTTELQQNINASVLAFQFYDRVCQRLDHVARSLEKVSGLLETENALHAPEAWKHIQENIKSSYTMEAERIMFEHIMRGGTVKDALEIYRHHFEETGPSVDSDNDEVELF